MSRGSADSPAAGAGGGGGLDRPRVIILMGLRGSGKSTLGRLVAPRLSAGTPFIDLDDRTMARLGFATVTAAWTAVGEPAFRLAETESLRTVLGEFRTGGVLALGGGTPTAPGAEALLRGAVGTGAALVYLRCTPTELRSRLEGAGGAGANRPSLTGRGALDEIDEVFANRDPLYLALATAVIESPRSRGEAVDEILRAR